MPKKKQIKCPDCGHPMICLMCESNAKKIAVKKEPKKTEKIVKTAAGQYAKTKKGVRPDVHHKYCFKSATEANFARLLSYWKLHWSYEERVFMFDGYKTKPHVYVMDFEITNSEGIGTNFDFVEVKGYMNSASRQKLRRFMKHYPEEAARTLIIVYSKYDKKAIAFVNKLGFKYLCYDALKEEYAKDVPGWE